MAGFWEKFLGSSKQDDANNAAAASSAEWSKYKDASGISQNFGSLGVDTGYMEDYDTDTINFNYLHKGGAFTAGWMKSGVSSMGGLMFNAAQYKSFYDAFLQESGRRKIISKVFGAEQSLLGNQAQFNGTMLG